MRISQLAERAGVPASTLRFYDEAGLLPAERSPAGYRLYGQDALDRLGFIGAAKHLGLALEEISELLEVWESGACFEVKAELHPRIEAGLVQAEARAAELSAFIGQLRRALEHLDALPDRAERCDPQCGFLAPHHAEPGRPVDLPTPAVTRPDVEAWRGAPVACSLTAGEYGERVQAWRRAVADAERRTIPGGLRLSVPAERAGTLAALCAQEQRCCPFFDFHLHFDGPVLHLEVRAPSQARELLDQLLSD